MPRKYKWPKSCPWCKNIQDQISNPQNPVCQGCILKPSYSVSNYEYGAGY